jgi:exonuclease III
MLICDKVEFKSKLGRRDKDNHFILIKGIINEEITIVNVCVPNISAPNYIKQTLLDPNTITVIDSNTPLSLIDRLSGKIIKKEISDTRDQMDLTDIYRVFHSEAAQYTFFSLAPGTFSNIDHILEHKSILRKYKKIKITTYILPDHKGIKLELKDKRNQRKMFRHKEMEQHIVE